MTVSLFVNVDHIATLRQARGTRYPDPIHGAVLCERAGADGITVHLREDRRHVQDRDVFALREIATTRMNLEVAATDEMVALAKKVRPDFVTLVPEKREERTTEGGLDVLSQQDALRTIVADLAESSIPVSLFIDPEEAQLRAAAATGAHAVEFHTGDYANAADPRDELARLKTAAAL
ncbi:MAG: pyridoxine 5'-phosphate synthase, partial [Myxococcota bacterium]